MEHEFIRRRAALPRFSTSHTLPPLHRCASDINCVNGNRLLSSLSQIANQRLLPALEAADMPLGMVLSEAGCQQEYAHFPTTCIVGMMHALKDGRTGAVSVVGHEGMVGVSMFMGGGGLPIRSVVLRAGRGYRLSSAALIAHFDVGGPVTRLLLRYAQAWMTQVAQVVVCNRHHSIDSRLCRLLLEMVDRLDGGMSFQMTQELISAVLGVRREGLSMAAARLQRLGLIRYQRGHITVLDRPGLERRSCECYAVVSREHQRLLPAPISRVHRSVDAYAVVRGSVSSPVSEE